MRISSVVVSMRLPRWHSCHFRDVSFNATQQAGEVGSVPQYSLQLTDGAPASPVRLIDERSTTHAVPRHPVRRCVSPIALGDPRDKPTGSCTYQASRLLGCCGVATEKKSKVHGCPLSGQKRTYSR